MLRDFAKLSLWNVLLCIFYRSESVGFLLSVVILSLLVTVLIIFDVIGSKYNYTLIAYPAVLLIQSMIRLDLLIPLWVRFMLGELACFMFLRVGYDCYKMIPIFENYRARLTGCPGH